MVQAGETEFLRSVWFVFENKQTLFCLTYRFPVLVFESEFVLAEIFRRHSVGRGYRRIVITPGGMGTRTGSVTQFGRNPEIGTGSIEIDTEMLQEWGTSQGDHSRIQNKVAVGESHVGNQANKIAMVVWIIIRIIPRCNCCCSVGLSPQCRMVFLFVAVAVVVCLCGRCVVLCLRFAFRPCCFLGNCGG